MSTPMLPVTKVSATVELSFGGKRHRIPVECEPQGLAIEPGVEDVYDAIESRYGWDRFVREVSGIAVARLLADVDVTDVAIVQVDEAAFEEAELEEGLRELGLDFGDE